MSRSLLFFQSVDFDQLKKQARELLRAYSKGDQQARALFAAHHDEPPAPKLAKLADAQLVQARDFDFPSWPRFKLAAEMTNAIRRDEVETVLALIAKRPDLLHENVFGTHSNWGPPLSVTAQLNAPKVFDALIALDGQDLDRAFGRAVLQGNTGRARRLLDRGAKPAPDEIMGPCESLNVEGLKFLVECGVPFQDEHGDPLAPVALLLEGYHRNPENKHACLAYCEEIGVEFPDTPVMAMHRGRIDLLQKHLAKDPELLRRRFSYRDLYPRELGCHEDESLGLHGAPLAGTTLLHMCMDFDETGIAHWLVENGADANARADIDAGGFGGHTPLFNIVVSQAFRSGRQRDGSLARLLLDNGADPNAAANLRKGIRFVEDEAIHEYRDMTPLQFGRAFHHREWISEPAMKIIATFGGR